MSKTLEDYLNEPELAHEPPALREVHAIRLMIHDEIKGMTADERVAYFNDSAVRLLGSKAIGNFASPAGKNPG